MPSLRTDYPFACALRATALVVLWLAGAACGAAESRVRIGVERGREGPLSFLDDRGQPSGFTRELLDEMSRVGEFQFELVPDWWSGLLLKFQSGQIDALANISITESKVATMDFSIVHATMHGVAYSSADRPPFRRTADFAGKRVALLSGTLEHSNAVKHGGWGGTLVICQSIDALFEAVSSGQCDLALLTRRLSRQTVKDRRLRSEYVEDIVHEYRIAVHKGDGVTLARINDALAKLKQSGDFDRIYAKWIGPIEPHPLRWVDVQPFVPPGVVLLLAVAFIIVWQRRMLAQRAAQAAVLRETEERYRGLVESAFDGSVIHQGGIIRTANVAYATMFGYAVEELIGRPVLDLTPPDSREQVARLIEDDHEAPYEAVGWRKDGSRIQIETSGKVCTFEGKPARIAAVRDITERKAAEEAIRRLNGELEQRVRDRTAELAHRVAEVERLYAEQQELSRSLSASQALADRAAARLQEVNAHLLSANQELEAFSYSVSHDLRAPLRNITGFIELLGQRIAGRDDAEARRFVTLVTTEAGRMGMLIDDLLTFSRIGRAELRLEPLALEPLVAEVREELRSEIGDRVIEWKIGPLPTVRGDQVLLRQVAANLLGNAVKFTRRCGAAVIEVGAAPSRDGDATVTFFVRDNGAGFNPKYLDKLFGVFQRLHNSRDFEGTGIGLANVKRIVNRHGGRVWAEGQVDKGATFYFTLARAEATA